MFLFLKAGDAVEVADAVGSRSEDAVGSRGEDAVGSRSEVGDWIEDVIRGGLPVARPWAASIPVLPMPVVWGTTPDKLGSIWTVPFAAKLVETLTVSVD